MPPHYLCQPLESIALLAITGKGTHTEVPHAHALDGFTIVLKVTGTTVRKTKIWEVSVGVTIQGKTFIVAIMELVQNATAIFQVAMLVSMVQGGLVRIAELENISPKINIQELVAIIAQVGSIRAAMEAQAVSTAGLACIRQAMQGGIATAVSTYLFIYLIISCSLLLCSDTY